MNTLNGLTKRTALLLLVVAWVATGTANAQQEEAIAPAVQEEKPAYNQEMVQQAVERARTLRAVSYPKDEPPDGHWFHSERGDFYVSRISKARSGNRYVVLPDKKIRLDLGLRVTLVEETEAELFVIIPRWHPPKRAGESNSDRSSEAQDIPAPTEPSMAPTTGDQSLVEAQRLDITTTPFDRGLPRSGQWRNGLAIADANNDGHLDLIHGPSRKGRSRPHIFLGDGEGSWKSARLRFRGGRLDYGDVAVGDFDADGQLDIALAMHLLGTTVGYGSDNFTFAERAAGFDRPDWAKPNSRFGKRAPWSSRAIKAIDVDMDGDLDLLALGEGAESLSLMRTKDDPGFTFSEGLTLYINNQEAPWTPWRFRSLPTGGDRLALGNFDADPEPEAVVAWGSSNARRLIVDFDLSNPQDLTAELQRPPSLGKGQLTFIKSVAAGDLLKGGVDEFVVGRLTKDASGWQSRIELHAREGGRADGTWQAFTLAFWPSNERVTDIAIGDIDGDGHKDIVAATGASRVIVLRNSGKGTFYLANHSISTPQYNCSAFSVTLGDLDGDGADEIIAGFAGETTNIPGLQPIRGCDKSGRLAAWRIDALNVVRSTSGNGAALSAVDPNFKTRGNLRQQATEEAGSE